MCNGLRGLKWVQTCIAWDCGLVCSPGVEANENVQYIYFICTFMCMFIDRCLSVFFWPLCCLFFDIRILITPLVSSNSSLNSNHILSSTKGSNKCPQLWNFVYKLMTLYSCLLPLSEKKI